MTDPPKPRVLLVGRGRTPPDGLREILESGGLELESAEAAAALRRLDEEGPLDLVVLEAGSPGGPWEALLSAGRVRRAGDRFVPMLLVTEAADSEARVRGLRLGADACVYTGAGGEELLARVEALLRIKGVQDRMAASRRELQRVATIDAVTGVANRNHLHARLREELRRARRYHDPVSLVLADLDGFRALGEAHGEAGAKQLLKDVAVVLLEQVREIDLVGRLGLDTFGLVLPHTHLSGALTVAGRVWRAVGALKDPGGSLLTCSVGLAFYPARGVSGHGDLLRVAQEALYRAKTEGRNRICLYQAAHYFYQPTEPDPDADTG